MRSILHRQTNTRFKNDPSQFLSLQGGAGSLQRLPRPNGSTNTIYGAARSTLVGSLMILPVGQ